MEGFGRVRRQGVGPVEICRFCWKSDEESSHALEPLRGPADPKAFGHCRRAPQGEIGKAGRGHLYSFPGKLEILTK